MYESDARETTLALLGDTIPTRRFSVHREDAFLKLRDILQGADAVFANLDASVHKYLDGNHAQRPEGGTYMTAEPSVLEDLRWIGIKLLACGSTHADDYGQTGIMDTIRHLDEAGIIHAGSGRHLAESRAPAYYESPRGRIALIAATGHFYPSGRAGAQRRDTAGNPGVNGLRHDWRFNVEPDQFESLQAIAHSLGWNANHGEGVAPAVRPGAAGVLSPLVGESQRGGSPAHTLDFLGNSFTTAEGPALQSSVHPEDLEANLQQVRFARNTADRVIVSLHCHDLFGPMGFSGNDRVADYVTQFARACIDNGADAFAGHGPQRPLGIEVYKGKPIFYSLGAFLSQLETVRYLPQSSYDQYGLDSSATPYDFASTRYGRNNATTERWEQAFALCQYSGDGLKSLHLYPLELGAGRPMWQRGRPVLATEEAADRVIKKIAKLSEPFGTKITNRNGIGVVEL